MEPEPRPSLRTLLLAALLSALPVIAALVQLAGLVLVVVGVAWLWGTAAALIAAGAALLYVGRTLDDALA